MTKSGSSYLRSADALVSNRACLRSFIKEDKMDVSVEPYGQYQGHNLYELTLTNDQGMVVKLLNYGAT
ncbi:MAG: galactose mutarotase, partial [Lacticaseibacillus paracasei]|nr:galactose mutarotase [Lacticaseibacillus paracasei]